MDIPHQIWGWGGGGIEFDGATTTNTHRWKKGGKGEIRNQKLQTNRIMVSVPWKPHKGSNWNQSVCLQWIVFILYFCGTRKLELFFLSFQRKAEGDKNNKLAAAFE